MKVALGRAVSGAFVVAFLALVAVGIAAYLSMRQLGKSRVEVEHTYAVLREVDGVTSALVTAESAVRGYVLTGDQRYLASFQADSEAALRRLAALDSLTRETPRQYARAQALEGRAREKFRVMATGIAVRRDSGFAAALALSQMGHGRAITDSARAVSQAIQADEQVLLRQRTERQGQSARNIALAMLLALVLALVLGLLAVQAVRRDISERTRAAEKLLAAKEAAEAASMSKSDFLATMSHELRTPLNSVIGFSNVLLKNKAGNLSDQDLSYLSRIVANGRLLLALINDVLDLSKVEAGRMRVERAPVDLAQLVNEVVAEFEEQGREREVAVRAIAPATMERLETDPVRLRQVVVNLVGNALKFTTYGSVTVRVDADAETRCPVRIRVIDTGDGIPDERQQAIFEAFEQADSGTARRYGGTGLGLTIARSLCGLLGYRLQLAWSRVGLGSEFSVLLVPGEEIDERRLMADSGELSTQGITPRDSLAVASGGPEVANRLVLIVDDDADSRLLLSQYVEDFGCQAMATSSAEQGLAAAREFRPDLIVLDLLMPGMNGWHLLEALRAEPGVADIPAMVVSIVGAESRPSLPANVDVLDKPVGREGFYSALRRNIDAVRGRVLVIGEDPESQREIALHVRDACGMEVLAATDGKEAMRVLASVRPERIVIDVGANTVEGILFIEGLRRYPRHAHIPVLVVTAEPLSDKARERFLYDAQAVIVRGPALFRELEEALRGTRRREESEADGGLGRRGAAAGPSMTKV